MARQGTIGLHDVARFWMYSLQLGLMRSVHYFYTESGLNAMIVSAVCAVLQIITSECWGGDWGYFPFEIGRG